VARCVLKSGKFRSKIPRNGVVSGLAIHTSKRLMTSFGKEDECEPGFLGNVDRWCPRPPTPATLSFYAYHAETSNPVRVGRGVNLASLGGMLDFLHRRVAGHCPRRFNITQIARYKVTIKATWALYGSTVGTSKKNFGPYLEFESGQCSDPRCQQVFAWYGHVPGCREIPAEFANYSGVPKEFSFPDDCPYRDVADKVSTCVSNKDQGECQYPNGSAACTYVLTRAGSISLAELIGIADYDEWCKTAGNIEYSVPNDAGFGTTFWDNRHDRVSCMDRVLKVETLFMNKYPNLPARLKEPVCDGEWFEGRVPTQEQ